MGIKEVINKAIRVIYPNKCIYCNCIIQLNSDESVCPSCESKLRLLNSGLCDKCGKPLGRSGNKYCYDCRHKEHYFEKGRALYVYESMVKRAIVEYKYYGKKNYYHYFGGQMVSYYIQYINWKIDIITSVPLHENRQKSRGYNQAQLLAMYLGKRLGIATNNDLLIRSKETLPQKELTDDERLVNVKSAFEFTNNMQIAYKNILIVDDIYTTGSTIDACAKVLLEHGANKTYFFTIAVGKGFS